LNPEFSDGPSKADGKSSHFPAIPGNGVVLNPTHFMPEEQVAVVQGQAVPGIEVNLDLHFVATDFLKGDQSRINSCCGLNEHPALHFRGQQPLQALELAHDCHNFT